jgi:L-malate glycosyltransferase
MPMTELVVQGETGMLFRGHNVQDAVKKVYGILDNPTLHLHMSHTAIDHVENNFAIQLVADTYIKLLNEICDRDSISNGEVNIP